MDLNLLPTDMKKALAIIVSIIGSLIVLMIISYIWVLLDLEGQIYKAFGAGLAYGAGTRFYKSLKWKYKL